MLVDNKEHVTATFIDVGDFCFLAGKPSERLLAKIKGSKLLVPRNAEWERLIESFYGSCAKKFTRYAIKIEPSGFDYDTRNEIYVLPLVASLA